MLTTTAARTGVWCCDFEIAGDGPLTSMVDPTDESTMRVLVRLHGEPLGYLALPRSDTPADVETIRRVLWSTFGDAIAEHLTAEGLPVPTEAERAGWHAPAQAATCPNNVEPAGLVSVVVCTRDRSGALPGCLDRLAAVTYPDVEFLIVDNAPSDDSTERLVEKYAAVDPRFRYVREARPGLSWARNAGLAAAKGRYIAYTDDDVAVDSGWVHGLVRGLSRRPDVGCVTGLVCTAQISNRSEAYFDARVSAWWSRCKPQLYDMSERARYGVLYPFAAGLFGTGANFAFDRELLLRLGGFDEALGAGTLTRGGEDLDIFVRILLDGAAIAYEPSAVAWHHHRADDESLLRQMYGYGSGLTAYLTKLLMDHSTRREVLRRIPAGLFHLVRANPEAIRQLTGVVPAPRGVRRRKLAGNLAGPLLYARSRQAVRRTVVGS
jgi:glycosyltransferase involved in cell wall biosynthesis